MSYRLTAGSEVIRDDGTVIAADPRNADWQGYRAWCAAGHTPAPYTPPPKPVPQRLSRRQFFQQAALQGLVTEAEALAGAAGTAMPAALASPVAALPAAQQWAAQMQILAGSGFDRGHPLTGTLGTALGWSAGQLDAFWTAAAAL